MDKRKIAKFVQTISESYKRLTFRRNNDHTWDFQRIFFIFCVKNNVNWIDANSNHKHKIILRLWVSVVTNHANAQLNFSQIHCAFKIFKRKIWCLGVGIGPRHSKITKKNRLSRSKRQNRIDNTFKIVFLQLYNLSHRLLWE